MTLLSTDEILATDDVQDRIVFVPEWKGSVRVIGLSGTGRDAYEASCVEMKEEGKGKNSKMTRTMRLDDMRCKLLVRCLVNDKGERLFGDAQISDLGKKSGRVLDRLHDIAKELSGIGDEDIEELAGK